MSDIDNNAASSYIIDTFEGIDRRFTDITALRESPSNIIARAKRYGRWWILKGIAAGHASDEAYLARLRKEFETLIMLSHPSVVSVTSLEHIPGIGEAIVMEFIDGSTLTEWLATSPTSKEKREVFRRLTEAVRYIHSHGVVHRDLKPENIMITRNGNQVKIIDFGLADTDSSTILKHPAGTPGYISPEQSEKFNPDIRNDIFSLGVILSQLNCGYGAIAKKCTLPAEKRIQDTETILHKMKRRDQVPLIASIAVISIVMIAAFAIIYYQSVSAKEELRAVASDNANLSGEVTALNDSIVSLTLHNRDLRKKLSDTDSLNKAMMEQRERAIDAEMTKERIVAEGKARIDKAFKETKLKEYIDTLSDYRLLGKDWGDKIISLYALKKKIIDEYSSSVSPSDLAEIDFRLTEVVNKHADSVSDKLNKLIKRINANGN